MGTTARKTTTAQVVELPDSDWVNPADNPGASNAEIASLISGVHETPVIDLPPDDLVNLPGGLVKDGQVIRTAVVRELTGKDEEALSKASQSLNPFHFIDRLLRCGVIQIGDLPESSTDRILKELLVGDREQLILGIRRATYGEDLDISNWQCSKCGNTADLSMQLSDIPITKMNNPLQDTSFDVKLRKGGSARVRLATGEDQIALFEDAKLTQAQRETILLSRCVIKINTNGTEKNVAAYPSSVLSMSVPDRHAILDELRIRQPGPKYDEIKYECESCGEEVTVAVGIGDLFLDFGWV